MWPCARPIQIAQNVASTVGHVPPHASFFWSCGWPNDDRAIGHAARTIDLREPSCRCFVSRRAAHRYFVFRCSGSRYSAFRYPVKISIARPNRAIRAIRENAR